MKKCFAILILIAAANSNTEAADLVIHQRESLHHHMHRAAERFHWRAGIYNYRPNRHVARTWRGKY